MADGGSGRGESGRSRSRASASAPARGRPRRRRRRIILIALALVVLLTAAAGALAFVGHDDQRVPGAVSVAGVDVSGLAEEDLRAAVRGRAAELMATPVVITRSDDPDFELTVPRRTLGARPLTGRAVRAALEPRGPGGRLLARLRVAPTREVPLDFDLDPEAVDRLVERANAGFPDPPVGATLEVRDGDVVVVPGRPGTGIDEAELRTGIAALPERIHLTVGEQPAPISDEAAQAARARALTLSTTPISITLQGRGVAVGPDVLRAALRFESRPPEIAVRFDPDTVYEDIAPAFEARETAPRDARFEVQGDSIRLIRSVEGRSLDMAAIVAAMAEAPPERAVRARFRITAPKVLTEELEPLGIRDLVGAFSTPYNCCEPRVTNIQVAADTLDGTILAPGERFSLNDRLGPRTTEAGYVEAPQISGGRLEDGVGGGVSQVATTLFNAAFFAGLEIETHTPHSFYISRYPAGREATISMGGPDLIFVNDWDAHLYISASAGDNDITIRLFSTSFDRRVETTSGEPTDYVEPEIVERVDSSLEPGAREVDQSSGSAGFSITYTRTVYQGDRVRREETYRWRYSAQNAFVRIGPEADEGEPADGEGSDGEEGAPDGEGEAPTEPVPEPAPEPEPQPEPAPEPAPAPDGGAAPPPPDLP